MHGPSIDTVTYGTPDGSGRRAPGRGAGTDPEARRPPTKCPRCGTRLAGPNARCELCARVARRRPPTRVIGRAVAPDPPSRSRSRRLPARRQKPGAAPVVTVKSEADTLQGGLRALGFMLAVGGFGATLMPGVWLGAGCLGICVGCFFGVDRPSHVARWRCAVLASVVLSALGFAIGANVLGRDVATVNAHDGPQPFLVVTVESTEYRDGELVIKGIVRNTGKGGRSAQPST